MAEHLFSPTHYFTNMGSHAPVLTIAPGDSVRTTTVDARGYDAANAQVTAPGNPMTGPFYVDGAQTGDTLVVHFDEISPNRRFGWGSAMLAPNVVDPDFVPHLPWAGDGSRPRAEWEVDMQAGVATLTAPAATRAIFVSVHPMLGCFGVAPARRRGHQHRDFRRSTAATWTTAISWPVRRSTSRC